MSNAWYTVQEHIETTYKTDDYSGKRYPSDYSIYEVINGDSGLAVHTFSALEYGLEDAEYMANELRDKLNKALPKPATVTEDMSHIKEVAQPLTQLHDEIAALKADNEDTLKKYAEAASMVFKLQADLEAAQAIIIDAGNKAEKQARINLKLTQKNVDLQNENEHLKAVLKNIADNAPQGIEQPKNQHEWGFWVAGNFARTAIQQTVETSAPKQAESEAVTPKPTRILIESGNIAQAPKFNTGDTVTVIDHEKKKPMTIRTTQWADGAYWYQLNYDDESLSYFDYCEDELEAQS